MRNLKTFESFNKKDYSLYDDPAFIDQLENEFDKNGSSFICTYVASMVKMLEGDHIKIYGFSQSQNPNAVYFNDQDDENEGHHFAVADDRYIIDPWIFNNYKDYPNTFNRSVFDLNNPNDQDEIQYLYGDQSKWVNITSQNIPFEEMFPDIALSLKDFKKNL